MRVNVNKNYRYRVTSRGGWVIATGCAISINNNGSPELQPVRHRPMHELDRSTWRRGNLGSYVYALNYRAILI